MVLELHTACKCVLVSTASAGALNQLYVRLRRRTEPLPFGKDSGVEEVRSWAVGMAGGPWGRAAFCSCRAFSLLAPPVRPLAPHCLCKPFGQSSVGPYPTVFTRPPPSPSPSAH